MLLLIKRQLVFVSFFAGASSALIIAFVVLSVVLKEPKEDVPAPVQKYINEEEAVIIPASEHQNEVVVLPIEKVLFEYVEVTHGCGPYYKEECVNVREGPGEDYPIISRLRNGMVLKVGGKVERSGRTWYKIVFNEWIRYPERVTKSWYVAGDYVEVLMDEGDKVERSANGSSTKYIVVERWKQKLKAYDGEVLFMEESISTGRDLTPTPRGTFTIYKKTPSRYMQGPIPGITDKYYDLPGVPWNLYFTNEGAVIHGTYWHDNFGKPSSNGCVNLPPDKAKKLYLWADVGTRVIVRD